MKPSLKFKNARPAYSFFTIFFLLSLFSLSSAFPSEPSKVGCIRALLREMQKEKVFLGQRDPQFGKSGNTLCGYTCAVNTMALVRRHIGLKSPFPSLQVEMGHVQEEAEKIHKDTLKFTQPKQDGISGIALYLLIRKFLDAENIKTKITFRSFDYEPNITNHIHAEDIIGRQNQNTITIAFLSEAKITSDLFGIEIGRWQHAVLAAGHDLLENTVFLIDPWEPHSYVSAKLKESYFRPIDATTQFLEFQEPFPMGQGKDSFIFVSGFIQIEFL